MSYRNKTYIVFDADNDMHYYRLMMAWKEHDHIYFDFYNAHDLSTMPIGSGNENYIKGKLRERMNNSKQAIVLVGNSTKFLHRFVRWEMELAINMDIPIIAVNLNQVNCEHSNTPAILKNTCYFVSVPFEAKKIKYALDNFPSEYQSNKHNILSSRLYNWSN